MCPRPSLALALPPYISELRLTDFRSYGRLDGTFAPGINVFFGPNGAGKTNLLEAVSLLSPGRGLRRATVEDITRQGARGVWGVSATLLGEDDTRVAVGQNPDAPTRRLVRIDGSSATGTQLAELLTVMWLTPAQDRLFTGPASDRRKFLDRFALTHTPDHGVATTRYEKARSERNRLLSDGFRDAAWFRALEADLARWGAKIAAARATTIALLREEIASRPDGAFPKADIALEGFAEGLFADGASLDDVRAALEGALAERRAEALRAGRTLVGPHTSDLRVRHAPKAMAAESCSTGEQKALLIGLVLAQARSQPLLAAGMAGRGRSAPILLLDEIAAHLDRSRRAALARELSDLGSQVFLTGTDRELFEDFDGARFRVADGEVQRV